MEWTFLTCLPRKYEERREEEDNDDNVAKGHGLPKFITHLKFTLKYINYSQACLHWMAGHVE